MPITQKAILIVLICLLLSVIISIETANIITVPKAIKKNTQKVGIESRNNNFYKHRKQE